MRFIVNDQQYVALPNPLPGDRLDRLVTDEGPFVLMRPESKPQASAKMKLEQRNGFSVGVLDHPINEQALAEALNEFP